MRYHDSERSKPNQVVIWLFLHSKGRSASSDSYCLFIIGDQYDEKLFCERRTPSIHQENQTVLHVRYGYKLWSRTLFHQYSWFQTSHVWNTNITCNCINCHSIGCFELTYPAQLAPQNINQFNNLKLNYLRIYLHKLPPFLSHAVSFG